MTIKDQLNEISVALEGLVNLAEQLEVKSITAGGKKYPIRTLHKYVGQLRIIAEKGLK